MPCCVESDVVTLHLPLNPDTHHFIGREQLATMKQGAFLVNTGRGALVDTDALLVALEAGSWAAPRWTCWKVRKGSSTSIARTRPVDHPFLHAAATAARTRSSPRTPRTTRGRALHDTVEQTLIKCLSFETEPGRMSRLTIAILFGGCSEEHDVSVKSATEIATSIDTQKYEPIYVGITKSGVWKMCELPSAEWEDGNCRRAVISPDRETHGLLVAEGGQRRTVHIDAVFPVLHGKTGEDGAVQGLLELSGIPYVGCDIQSSTTCMDKSLAYTVARSAGIDTPEFWVLNGADMAVPDALAYPVFVKPARSGSSFGVTKVERAEELDAALMAARRYDSKVLIEQAVLGTEVGCAVLGNGSELFVGAVDQIELLHGIFRIHQEAEPEKGSENAVDHRSGGPAGRQT